MEDEMDGARDDHRCTRKPLIWRPQPVRNHHQQWHYHRRLIYNLSNPSYYESVSFGFVFLSIRWSQNYRSYRGDPYSQFRADPVGGRHCAVLQSMGQNPHARAVPAQVPATAPIVLSDGRHRIAVAHHQSTGVVLADVDGRFVANSAEPLWVDGRRRLQFVCGQGWAAFCLIYSVHNCAVCPFNRNLCVKHRIFF